MGNEFGHPEWIDFPREGNNWSYHYARRQWSLADNPRLKYQWLKAFDADLIQIVTTLREHEYHYVSIDEYRRLISFVRDNYLFVVNLSPNTSYTDFSLPTINGKYRIALNSDNSEYGGFNRVDTDMTYSARNNSIKLYLPNRTGMVLKKL